MGLQSRTSRDAERSAPGEPAGQVGHIDSQQATIGPLMSRAVHPIERLSVTATVSLWGSSSRYAGLSGSQSPG